MSNSIMRSTSAGPDVFWGELAPCEHLLQLYENNDVFLNTLEEYVHAGLLAGEGVVVISTAKHAKELKERLRRRNIDAGAEQRNRNLYLLNAESTLETFITHDGWPNDDKFHSVVSKILEKPRGGNGRRVRAFGEMVVVLWDRGQNAATVRLEHLWQRFCREQKDFSLFCAYPRAGFTDYALKSLQDICAAHSRVIG